MLEYWNDAFNKRRERERERLREESGGWGMERRHDLFLLLHESLCRECNALCLIIWASISLYREGKALVSTRSQATRLNSALLLTFRSQSASPPQRTYLYVRSKDCAMGFRPSTRVYPSIVPSHAPTMRRLQVSVCPQDRDNKRWRGCVEHNNGRCIARV